MRSLPERYINRTVGGINPAGGHEPDRAVLRCVFRYVFQRQFHVVIPCDALVLSVSERGKVPPVLRVDEVGHVAAQIVPCLRYRMGFCSHMHLHFRGWEGKPLVHVDIGIVGVIDDQKRNMIEEVRLPQFGCDAHIVPGGSAVLAGAGRQLIAAYPDPVLGGHDPRRFLGIDLEPQR